MAEDKLLTTKEAADFLGVSQDWIAKLIKKGKLVGALQDAPVKYYLVSLKSLEEYKKLPKDKGGRPRKS